MSKENLPESIAGHPRTEIDEYYGITLTDKQWKLLVEYTTDPDPEYETVETLIVDFVNKIDLMEWASDEYTKQVEKLHGKDWKDKNGDN